MRFNQKSFSPLVLLVLATALVACDSKSDSETSGNNQTSQGPRGATGPQGPMGPAGAPGAQGIQGLQGVAGPSGAIQLVGAIELLPSEFRGARLMAGESKDWTNNTGKIVALTTGVQMYTNNSAVYAQLLMKTSAGTEFIPLELYLFKESYFVYETVYHRVTSRVMVPNGATIRIKASSDNINDFHAVDIILESFYQVLN